METQAHTLHMQQGCVVVCCAPWAVLQATDRGLRQVAALSCYRDSVQPPILNVWIQKGWMHGQVEIEWIN